ncbi:hypothetical protein [Halobacillus sp. H74]|uniref:hypothetical protein n=1 Tax=Halobacillus sp. H74 TaxID=3457436 RepID=UPI003FCE5255
MSLSSVKILKRFISLFVNMNRHNNQEVISILKIVLKASLLAFALLLAAGCSDLESSSTGSGEKETPPDASQESEDSLNVSEEKKSSDSSSPKESMEGEETVRTYLEYEFTGPGKALRQALDESHTELFTYVERQYKPLFPEDNYEKFVNENYVMNWMPFAYEAGYELEPVDIQIDKVEDIENDAYQFEIEVEYSKDEEIETANVSGRINTNDQGKISVIRIQDDGLNEKLRNH